MAQEQNEDKKEETYLSRKKREELKQELEHLKTVRRKEIAEQLAYAKSLGDLSENSEYQEAREAQATLEERISTIEELLKSAVLIQGGGTLGGVVDVGSTVTVQKKKNGSPEVYYLVGSEEADIAEKKISNKSPLGEALIGKKKGDSFVVKAPSGKIEYSILEVS